MNDALVLCRQDPEKSTLSQLYDICVATVELVKQVVLEQIGSDVWSAYLPC